MVLHVLRFCIFCICSFPFLFLSLVRKRDDGGWRDGGRRERNGGMDGWMRGDGWREGGWDGRKEGGGQCLACRVFGCSVDPAFASWPLAHWRRWALRPTSPSCAALAFPRERMGSIASWPWRPAGRRCQRSMRRRLKSSAASPWRRAVRRRVAYMSIKATPGKGCSKPYMCSTPWANARENVSTVAPAAKVAHGWLKTSNAEPSSARPLKRNLISYSFDTKSSVQMYRSEWKYEAAMLHYRSIDKVSSVCLELPGLANFLMDRDYVHTVAGLLGLRLAHENLLRYAQMSGFPRLAKGAAIKHLKGALGSSRKYMKPLPERRALLSFLLGESKVGRKNACIRAR